MTAPAPGPTTTIDYVARRVVVRLALAEIDAIRTHHDFSPLRRTPPTWHGGSVEHGRREAAERLRECLRLLRAVKWTGRTPGRRGFVRPAKDGPCVCSILPRADWCGQRPRSRK